MATNTLKHTAAGSDHSRVVLRSAYDRGHIVIEYRDDGPGFPAEVLQGRRHGGGLKLIEELVGGTLRGELCFGNDNGAVTTLRIRIEEPRRT